MNSIPKRAEIGKPGSNPAGEQAPSPALEQATDSDMDLSLLEVSLAKTPWERMQANDDAVRFMDSLQTAMRKRNAKP